MEQYIGLDVSMKETAISIRQDGKRIWRGKCAPNARRVVFETGPLSVWFYHALTAEGLPVICIDARHAKAALDTAANKTDANDADGLAHLAEVGFYREVRVKRFRQHADPHADHRAAPASQDAFADIQPDPWLDEDVRPHRAQGRRQRVRA